MKLTDEEMQEVRRIAASFIELDPLKSNVLRGERDEALVVQVVKAGFIAGKANG